uniref:Reverse transcriptase Ty1/copia-type domain-containing protein n=1 Tax=Fagus sylvatica TaxID=28930 RepID=A0A2N9ETF7_FAGSY
MSSSSSSTTDAISPSQPRYTPLLTPSTHLQIKLTKDNYLSWKTVILPYINGNKILHYIDGTTAAPPQYIPSPTSSTILIPNPAFTSWFEIDQLLLSILVSTISEPLIPTLVGRSSSRDVWLTLEKMFSSQSRARIMQTRYHLATLKKGNLSIPNYFQKAKSYADLLASIGQPIHDNDLITQILAGLPSDYNDLATVPDLSTPMANLATKTTNPAPQGRPSQYSSNRGSNGYRGCGRNNYSRSRGNGGSSSSFTHSNNGSRPPCQIYFKVGHTASACWHRFEQQYQAPMASQPGSQAFVAATSPSIDQVWYPDTGANNHLTADLSHLNLNAEHYTGSDQVRIGNGQDNNVFFEFHPSFFCVKDLFSDATLLKGPSKDGLYPLHSLPQIKPRALLGERVPTTQWHARLGHPSLRIVRQVLSKHHLAVSTNNFPRVCHACQLGKSHRLPFYLSPSSLNHKGYKCLDLSTNWMYIARNVIFDENQFPFSATSSPSHSGPTSSPLISIPSLQNFTATSTQPPYNSEPTPSLNTNPPTPPFLESPPNITSHSHQLPLMSTSPNSTQYNTSPAHDISLNPTAAPNPHVSSPTALPVSPTPPAHTMNLQPHPHPMCTRSHDNIVQPKQFYPGIIRYPLPKALLTLTASTPPEPSCFTEASKSAEWRAAMATEFTALLKNSTWTLVPPKPNTNVVGCKWVFHIKRDAAGTIERYKARLVAKGFHQQHGVDYGDTFSPDIRQLDVTNAFLHGVLSEDVYMTQPAGFVHPSYPHHVCHLRKALYGLKEAPCAWYSRLSTRLLDLGFKGCKSDTSLFIHRSGPELILFLIYVDDIIITGTNSTSITRLINTLQGDFALKDLGPLHFFLGVEAHKVDSGMYLSQRRYITDLLRKTNLHEAKPVASPMASSTVLSQHTGTSLSDPSLYRSVVGSLQYLSLTRPDISFAINKVCQFMANPTEDHWSAMIRRSTAGYCLFLGRNLISWTSLKQRTVSRSSTESEYRAVAHASTEIIWLCSLLSELGLVSSTPPLLWCDNIGATYLTANPLFHARTKHIEIDVHFVRDLVASKALSIRFISSKDQLADTFTKPLPMAKFTLLRDNLNVRELPLRLRGHIRTALPISVTDTSLKSTDKEQMHQQDIHKS